MNIFLVMIVVNELFGDEMYMLGCLLFFFSILLV